jgi:PKD repeat protein
VYALPGTYTATLTVTDGNGAASTASLAIVVTEPVNQPPVAAIGATPTSGTTPLTVSFSSAGSADPDGTITERAWTFGDGGTSTAVDPVYVYRTAGTFVATLTVTDNRGARASRTVTINVVDPPVGPLTMAVAGVTIVVEPAPPVFLGRAQVTILDTTGAPVRNALVTGRWFGLVPSSYLYALTDAQGRASFTSKTFSKGGGLGFSVHSVSKEGLPYDASRNVETTATIVFEP